MITQGQRKDGDGAVGPLAGIRVIDCSRGTAGPRATGLLADYGADVIWIEPPGGDPYRDSLSIAYSAYNRGKRSVTLDLHDKADHDALLSLLASADLFVHSWRPGVAENFGLSFASLHEQFPRLVCCQISGFGLDGPQRDIPGYEALVHALVGTMGEQIGHREGPIFQGLPFGSIGASYLALIGALAALYRRNIDGRGRFVETSLLDGALAYLSMTWGDSDKGPQFVLGSYRLVSSTYRCADDEYIGVHSGAVGAFGRLMVLLGLDKRVPPSESGLDMGVPIPEDQRAALEDIHDIFLQEDRDTWMKRLHEADICAIPVLRPCEVFDEPQALHNKMVVTVDDADLGRIQQVAPPAKFSKTPGVVRQPAPTIGQDTAEVLAESKEASEAALTSEVGSDQPDQALLDGLRVLDLSAYYAGPFSSRLLADLGADVIKLEPPVGDQLRNLDRMFGAAQAGKRSIAIDVKDSAAQPALIELIKWADVIHHNLRPGAADRLGVGYEQAAALHPDVIYLQAPGWGSSGPNMYDQSFAPLMSGYVGAGYEVAGQFNPPLFPLGNEDPGNGLLGAVAILMALVHHQRTEEGQLVENSQLNATMAHMTHIVRGTEGQALGADRLDPLQFGYGPLERLYQTADDWICLVVRTEEQYKEFCDVLAVDGLSSERFADEEAREANGYALEELLADTFSEQDTATWLSRFAGRGVPIVQPISEKNNLAYMRDPENQRSGRVAECPHGSHGKVRELAHFVRVEGALLPPHRLAPLLGEHTDSILSWLGYSPDTIAEMHERGVVRSTPS